MVGQASKVGASSLKKLLRLEAAPIAQYHTVFMILSYIVVEAEYMLVSHNFAPERANQTYFTISVILLSQPQLIRLTAHSITDTITSTATTTNTK